MITRKPHWINDFQHEHLHYKPNFNKKIRIHKQRRILRVNDQVSLFFIKDKVTKKLESVNNVEFYR